MQKQFTAAIILCIITRIHTADSPISSGAATLAYAQITEGYQGAAKITFGDTPIAHIYKEFHELGIIGITQRYPNETVRAQETEINFRFAAADKHDRVTELTLNVSKKTLHARIAAWDDFNNALKSANHASLQHRIPGFIVCHTHKETITENSDLTFETVGGVMGRSFSPRSALITGLLVIAFRYNYMETKDPEAFKHIYNTFLKIPNTADSTTASSVDKHTVWSRITTLFRH